MSVWEQLRTTAVQGSGRRPPDRAEWLTDLDDLAVGLAPDDAEAVLEAAALLTAARRSGATVQFVPPPDDPVPPDERPVVPREVFDLLDGTRGEYEDALDVAFAEARRRGLRLPPERAPDLLDRALRRPSCAADVIAGLGPRAPWLAARNRAWADLMPEFAIDRFAEPGAAQESGDTAHDAALDDRVWRQGTSTERVTWLWRLRRHDPAAAYDYLAATLGSASEPIDFRCLVISLLANGSSDPEAEQPPGEEALLEACLEARAQDVRRAAADVLGTWRTSALAQRMRARAVEMVRVQGPQQRLVITVPDDFDAAALRDGLGKPRHLGTLSRAAAALHEVLLVTPLDFWERFGSPEHVLELVRHSRHPAVIVAALGARTLREYVDADGAGGAAETSAAGSSRSVVWADAIVQHVDDLDPTVLGGLAPVCSAAVRDERSLRLIRECETSTRPAAFAAARGWFEHVPFPLTDPLCQVVIEAMPRLARQRAGAWLVEELADRIGAEQPTGWHGRLEVAGHQLLGRTLSAVFQAVELQRRRQRVIELLDLASGRDAPTSTRRPTDPPADQPASAPPEGDHP